MANNLFDFENIKERNDFFISLAVIAFFGWLLFHFIYCENVMQMEELPTLQAEVAPIVIADMDGDGIADEEDNCPRLSGIAENNGCPADSDQDGIYDEDDACPNLAGTAVYNGCPPDGDRDGDGFSDKNDRCPDIAGDDKGCPPDADGDGIANDKDKCPEDYGLATNDGCPLDADGDGIFDKKDKCPNLAGIAENNGCPADGDGDGIYDQDDKCPQLAGIADNNGCPADGDGDGVYDKDDKCPNLAGTTSNNGCPADSDGDGVYDKDDKCPNKAGDAANNGCPEIKVEEAEKKVIETAIKSVAFLPNSPNLTIYSQGLLKKVADILKKYPDYKLRISGHTDSIGGDESNLKLSQARANTCRQFLINQGIGEGRLSSEGYGESKPIDNNNTVAGRKKNRRVEFELHY